MKPKGTTATFGNRLRDFRVKRLLTQAALAEQSGVGVWVIAQTEQGKHRPGPLSQEKLAQFFGVPRDILFPEPAEQAAV